MNFEDRSDAEYVVHSCPACGNDAVKEQWASEDFIYGSGKTEVTLTVQVPKMFCSDCNLWLTDDRAETIRHEAVSRHLNLQSPNEIIRVRKQLGLNQQEFSDLARFGRASLGRWESGELHQNGSSDSLIYLLSFPENASRLRCRFEPQTTEVRRPACKRTFRALSPDQVGALGKRSKDFSLYYRA